MCFFGLMPSNIVTEVRILRIPLLSLFIIIPFHWLGMFKFLKNLTSRKLLWGTLTADFIAMYTPGFSDMIRRSWFDLSWFDTNQGRKKEKGKSPSYPRQKGNEGYLIAGFWEFNTLAIEPRKIIARKRRKLQSFFFTLTWFVDCLMLTLITDVYLIRRLVHFKYRILTLQIPHFRVLFCSYF